MLSGHQDLALTRSKGKGKVSFFYWQSQFLMLVSGLLEFFSAQPKSKAMDHCWCLITFTAKKHAYKFCT